MKRLLFYLLRFCALACRLFSPGLYMTLILMAHRSQGVTFTGRPEYIHQDAHLDPEGGLTIARGCVVSMRVIILTHDWSFLKRAGHPTADFDAHACRPVSIGEDSFIGAGAIVLPGTSIGRNCIIGAGAVVKGVIPDHSVVIGNPAKVIGLTR